MKKLFAVLWLFLLIGLSNPSYSQDNATQEWLYVGTSSERGSQGIYVFAFDREKVQLTLIQTFQDKDSPNFLAVHPDKNAVYAACGEGIVTDPHAGSVAAYSIDSEGRLKKINQQSSKGPGSCHVSVDPLGEYVYVSNYSDGSLAVLPVRGDGGLEPASDVKVHEGSGPNKGRQSGPHMHSMVPASNGNYVYASDLGIDAVIAYELDRGSGTLQHSEDQVTKSKPGGGPRHFDIHPSGKYAYSLEELTSTLAAYAVDQNTGGLKLLERENMLPDDYNGRNKAADIQVSPDGKTLYASNRGHNSLAVFAVDQESGMLELITHTDTQGKTPRNLLVDPEGEFVFVANRSSDQVAVFNRNQETGTLAFSGEKVFVPAAVCIQHLKRD